MFECRFCGSEEARWYQTVHINPPSIVGQCRDCGTTQLVVIQQEVEA